MSLDEKVADLTSSVTGIKTDIEGIHAENADLSGYTHSLEDKIDKVTETLQTLQATLGDIREGHPLSSAPGAINPRNLQESSFGAIRPSLDNPVQGAPGSSQTDAYDKCQTVFRTISKKYNSVNLHPDLVFTQDKSGIKKIDQGARAIASNVAQYIETLLKITIDLDTGSVTEQKIDEIASIGIACMTYLKGEHTGLLVKGRFGPTAGGFFRQLQTHTSAFDEKCMDNIQKAVTLTSHMSPANEFGDRQQGYGWQGRGGRQSYRSNYRGGYQNYRGGYQTNQPYRNDFYDNYVNRDIPQRPFFNNRGRGQAPAPNSMNRNSQSTQYDNNLQ